MMKYELLWQEEFLPTHDGRPDSKFWNFDLGDGSTQEIPGWGNQEREFYTEDNAEVNSGLTITARKSDPQSAPDAYYGKAEWLSSRIQTVGKVDFKYGRFDFEVQAPKGGGSWPAIWMLGSNISEVKWSDCGEIDIFEGAGNRPKEIRGTLHGPGYEADKGITGALINDADLSEGVHTFSIEWLPDQITWYADSRAYLTIGRHDVEILGKAWPFNANFYLVINLAMGGWFSGDVVDGFDKCEFKVHSIRHYSIDGIGEVSFN